MKTSLISCAVMVTLCFAAALCPAQDTVVPATDSKNNATNTVQNERWDGMLAGFWFNAPTSIETANVSGLKLGLPISSGKGKVVGFEWGFCCTTDNVNGFQWAMLAPSISNQLYGVQMSLVNIIEKDLVGAQIGIVNVGKKSGWQFGIVNHADNIDFQLGLVNFNKNGRFPFMVGVNWNK